MALSNIPIYSSSVESAWIMAGILQALLWHTCSPPKKRGRSIKEAFTHKHAALRSALPPHAAKCDLPMAIKKIHYHSFSIQQQEGLFIFLGWITRNTIFPWKAI